MRYLQDAALFLLTLSSVTDLRGVRWMNACRPSRVVVKRCVPRLLRGFSMFVLKLCLLSIWGQV